MSTPTNNRTGRDASRAPEGDHHRHFCHNHLLDDPREREDYLRALIAAGPLDGAF